MFRKTSLPALLVAAVVAECCVVSAAEPVRFNRDIRPILADNCFKCHGPDSAARQADLRLDLEAGVVEARGDVPAVVARGSASTSELYRRITSDDPDVRMPPPDSGKSLTESQIELLKCWIDAGAVWEEHWAFQPPVRTAPPATADRTWPRNSVDAFVLAALEKRGRTPSPEAAPETLLRRVTLDLTGLPPTPAELDAFRNDAAPDRYERLVERLLASPRFGEQMALDWLDAARFADTSGYQTDGVRDMSRWRDWVIAAYNSGMPFDQFTIEQLAGDLLPNPTLDQLIATGFNRNHRANSEGGIIPEEYQVEYVVDRVDTTGGVWLGLTIGCARCHEHKYDPISHEEYYRLFAYFNNVPEYGRALKLDNSPPFILSPTEDQQRQLSALEAAASEAEAAWNSLADSAAEEQRNWERAAAPSETLSWTIADTMEAWFPLAGDMGDVLEPERVLEYRRQSSLAAANTVEVATGKLQPDFGNGPTGGSVEFDGSGFLAIDGVGVFGYLDSFTAAAWVRPHGTASGGIVSRMVDDATATGWALHLRNGHLQVNLVTRWLDDAVRVETVEPLAPDEWQHVAMTYDGTRLAKGIRVYVNGEPRPVRVLLDALNSSFVGEDPIPLCIGSSGTTRRLTGAIADVRVYRRVLAPREVKVIAAADSIDRLLQIPADNRTPAQRGKLQEYFLTHVAPEPIQRAYRQMHETRAAHDAYLRTLPTTMVMVEMDPPRETHVLLRGAYDKPGERVTAGVPRALLAGRPDPGGNRLDLARWIVDPSNPLTARVTVNRLWQKLFGIGLVKTSEDFGTQGELPSHPELLDWLATEFVRTNWDIKAMLRLLVTSATYRQSSAADAELIAEDPENRWLARGPRFRLPAETIRDQALAVSGLLEERLGGPSIKPYQPEGLWQEIATDTEYVQSVPPDLYRRSLYAFIKRTVANPTLAVFDASTREFCLLRRSRTNTPLQALTLLNDVTFVEAARVLAERVLREGGDTDEARITHLMRLALSREPAAREMQVLTRALHGNREHFRTRAEDAAALLRTGASPADPAVDPAELAAYTLVSSLVLNLDEFITKE